MIVGLPGLNGQRVESLKTFITFYNFLRGQYKPEDLDSNVTANVQELLPKVNRLLNIVDGLWDLEGKKLNSIVVTSGYRSVEHNKRIGGSGKSAHCLGKAVDIADAGNHVGQWLKADWKKHGENSVLAICELWLEDPDYSPGWCHLSDRPVGVRVFKP